MKGIVFQLLGDVITDAHGADMWDEVLDAAGLDGVYTTLGSYPDHDLESLVAAAAVRLETDEPSVIRWFGRSAIPMLAKAHPDLFAPHASTLPFLLTLNDIIHPEVRKLYPEAEVPEFDFTLTPDGLDLVYRSRRTLCALAEGFILGAADHFGETVGIEQPECRLRGDDQCRIRCRFGGA